MQLRTQVYQPPPQALRVTVLKPTLGRIPHATTVEPVEMPISNQLLGVIGPLARRVAELRAAFDVMAGPTWRDPLTVPGTAARTGTGPAPALQGRCVRRGLPGALF